MKEILIDREDFKEEEKHLDELVQAIMLILNNPQKYLPFSEVSRYDTAIDYDDAEELHFKKKSNDDFFNSNIQPWIDHIDQPYYGRFDVNVDGEFKSIYIGEEDLYKDNERVVYSGQSPIGMFFTQTALKNGGFSDTKYEALLRRRLLIEKKELVLAEDVFIAGMDPKFQGITDPYLLRVLQNNRKKSSMTSILSSIQEKQFEIVCLPRESSFIVQGCAGSGKTAILFQRLSNIQYNNPGYINDKVRIISPNPGFIEFIGPLAKQLKLTHLTPITMADYYNELLKRYGLETINNIDDENSLNKNLVKEIYSDDVVFEIANRVKKYIDEHLTGCNIDNLARVLNAKGFNHSIENLYVIDKLDAFIMDAIPFIEEYTKKYNSLKIEYEKYTAAIKEYCKSQSMIFDSSKETISDLFVLIKKEIFALVTSLNNYVSSRSLFGVGKIWLSNPPTTNEIFSIYDSIKDIENAEKEKEQNKSSELSKLKEELNSLLSFDKEKWEKETLPALIKERDGLETNLKGLTFFALVRKQMIKNRINEINKIIADQSSQLTLFETTKNNLETKINDIEESIKNNATTSSSQEIDEFKKKLDDICLLVKAIDFFNENYDFLLDANVVVNSYSILKAADKEKPFDYKKIYKNIILPIVHELYEKHGYKAMVTSDKINGKSYQFNMYIRLTLASLFLSKPFNRDKMLCIDEGQEYSKNEFILVTDINSDEDSRLILNIYGDVNQRNTEKGIDDWSVFVPDLCSKAFNLYENYRNTAEIVKYTNLKLGLKDIAIGIDDGTKVDEVQLNEALRIIKNGNICIIVKEDSDLYLKLIGSVEFNNKTNGNIVLTPWLSKGQEFETVIVFDKEMDKTEKYISYTRAKSKLYICSEF